MVFKERRKKDHKMFEPSDSSASGSVSGRLIYFIKVHSDSYVKMNVYYPVRHNRNELNLVSITTI